MTQIFDIPNGFDAASELKELLPLLPQWRRQKTLSYRQNIDRFLCAKSFLMLEDMLRENFGLAHCPEFSYDSHGKPYFSDYPGIFFNISHCQRGIVCAVMDKPVGIDIEEILFDEDLAKVIFNPEELEAVRSADEPEVKFTEFWTRKESFLKLTGEGLRDNLKDVLSDANEATISTGINRSVGYIHSVAIWEEKLPARLSDEHQKNI